MSQTQPAAALFDANCALGMVSQPGPAGVFLTAEELLEHQAPYGITRALPFHTLALEEHPATGNAKLLPAIEGHAALQPSWIALPHHTGEFPDPATLLAEARSAGVRALRLFPDDHKYPVDDWMLGDFFAAVAGQVPLFWHIARLDTPTARDIYRVCSRIPACKSSSATLTSPSRASSRRCCASSPTSGWRPAASARTAASSSSRERSAPTG